MIPQNSLIVNLTIFDGHTLRSEDEGLARGQIVEQGFTTGNRDLDIVINVGGDLQDVVVFINQDGDIRINGHWCHIFTFFVFCFSTQSYYRKLSTFCQQP